MRVIVKRRVAVNELRCRTVRIVKEKAVTRTVERHVAVNELRCRCGALRRCLCNHVRIMMGSSIFTISLARTRPRLFCVPCAI